MTRDASPSPVDLVRRASASNVAGLFFGQVALFPERVAVEDGAGDPAQASPTRTLSYRQLGDRVLRLAARLREAGVTRGERVAILSENRLEYLELFLAAAHLGAVVACQNWRLKPTELAHCIGLVEPKLALVSPRHASTLEATRESGALDDVRMVQLGDAYEAWIRQARPAPGDAGVDPEDPLLILYTSGTTGLPKGAVLSHRAEIVRNLVVRAEFGVAPTDAFVAWSPLYHMGAAECSLGALMAGGQVIVLDGYQAERLATVVEEKPLGWLLLMPGMVSSFADELERRGSRPRGVKLCGVMADLVPPDEIARVTRLLQAPFANTFGATETGCPPCSSNRIPVGVVPASLSKQQSPFCEIRLVDDRDEPVAPGAPGELCIRGPTLFSGYFRADEVNQHEFRGGWFHMGDVFVQNPDGTLDFVDRVKYLIKSGGENVYPAEIERVMLQDERVLDVAVVRRPDARWGEVPVAFVARRDESLDADELYARCRRELAGYKQPKGIFFIQPDDLPRSASGKIQRHELEKRLDAK